MYFVTQLILLVLGSTVCVGKKSFTVLLDTTSSMQEEIDLIKSGIGVVVNILNETEVEKYILVPFNDPDVGPPIYSTSPENIITALNAVHVSGGHDCPENSLAGIQKALEVSDEESYIFAFTDAYAKDNRHFADIQNLCQKTRSQVVIFLSGRCYPESIGGDINVYFEIAKSCSGSLIRLEPPELRQAFEFIKGIVRTGWNEIITLDAFTNYKDFSFSVDAATTRLMVAVYGDNTTMRIVDKDGQSPTIDSIIDTKHSIVFRINDLKIGQYRIIIRCFSTTSATIYKKNVFPFQYGFSTRFPKTMKETSLRPLPGWTNYFAVIVPPNSATTFDTLELLKISTNEKTTLRVQESNEIKGLFYTSAFFEADTTFQISVSGKYLSKGEDIVVSTNKIDTQNRAKQSQWTSPVIETIESETLIDMGLNATLACKVTGYPKPVITWEDDTGKYFASEDVLLEIPNVFISYATIHNVSSNSTIYCKAKNSKGESYQTQRLFVHRAPIFNVIQVPRDETIPYGTEGRLYCEVNAYPEAKTKWYHNESLIDTFSSNVVIKQEENLLLIKNMKLEDIGEYKCEIQNEIESRTFTATVDISGLEQPSIEIENSQLNLKPGDWSEIECVAKGLPKPETSWKFKKHEDDQFTSIPDGVYVEGIKLKIPSVLMNHSGIYRCEASNILGMAYQDVNIQIQYTPVITNVKDTLNVNEGDMVQLQCDVDAMPAARVHWEMFQDDVIIAFDDRHTTDDSHVHRFEALWKDSGKYHCIAENSMGRTEKTVTVNVLVPPYIETPSSKTITARVGSSVSLLCNVLFGNPVPTTIWQFMTLNSTTTVLLRNNAKSILRLTNIQKGNEGYYMCIADNEVGTDSIKIYLNVQ